MLPTSIRNSIAWRKYVNYLQNQSTNCYSREIKFGWLEKNLLIITNLNWNFFMSSYYVYHVIILESQWK